MIKEALEILAQEPEDNDDDEVADGNDYDEVSIMRRRHSYNIGNSCRATTDGVKNTYIV